MALCVLVRTRGSTPQKAGAVMLVLADGNTVGTIGGGCVEAEVRSRSLQLILSKESRLFTFKLDHDHGWDDGLVCGGVVDVAVQIISSSVDAAPFREARDCLASGKPAELKIAVEDEQGTAQEFLQLVSPPPTLIIAGAGHVGSALATIASLMDFSVVLIDDREGYASADRFPGVDCRCGPVEEELSGLKLGDQSYVVIVTRGHRRDGQALAAVISSGARYIGLIGSRRKILQIYSDLHGQGVSVDRLSEIHAPIGLKIAAVTPTEIAISIAAELIAVRRGESSGSEMRMNRELIERHLKSDQT